MLADAVLEDVGEADQHRELDVALAQLVDELLEVDLEVRVAAWDGRRRGLRR